METKKTSILAVVGKGGVGKTSISAALTRLLSENRPDSRIIAIDADPAMGLSTALGIEVTKTLDDIRKSVTQTASDGKTKEAIELLNEARFQIFDTIVEKDNFSFLAIGRPESAGCYCSINTYLRELIGMLAKEYDYVIIDGEAGIEQINRRVMERVTHLIMVTDQSKKGIAVIKTIKNVADDLVLYDRLGIIINSAVDSCLNEQLALDDLSIMACISEDKNHAMNEILNGDIFSLQENSLLLQGAAKAMNNLSII